MEPATAIPLSDAQLLLRFSQHADQAAFAQLVDRHLNLVYGTARRTLGTGHPQLDDAVQAAFWLLARRPPRLGAHATLAGWLFRVTRYSCANILKTERRRQARQREVATMHTESQPAPESLQPLLDDALASLAENQRQAILLHYLQRHSAADTARHLGISTPAVTSPASSLRVSSPPFSRPGSDGPTLLDHLPPRSASKL